MKPITCLLGAVIPVLLCSFLSWPPQNEVIIFSQFWQEKTLSERPLATITEITPDGLALQDDSLLFVRAKDGSNYHFSVMNLRPTQWTGRHMPTGNGHGQSSAFISYGLHKERLWVYDLFKDKLVVEPLQPQAGSPTAAQEFALPAFYYSLQMINDSMALGSGDYDATHKLALINYRQGSIIRQILPYYNPEGNDDRAWKSAYESFLFLKPGADKCVLACRYADQIEIVDLPSGQSKIIKGPENYSPDVTAINQADGKEISARNYKTRYAFVKGKVTDRYIYLLYSGNNHETSHRENGKYLYIFDWNGVPLQKITLQQYALDFAVSSNDKKIYLYHPGNKQLSVADL
ncbi:BF3164 family lipoprotein [Paraflavitalea sp. CAU 1676]|uniref:BF3164 family lipoprotein n=1 Tax=Paraflavitalea sp. CAU 1676 TaxID=3032598 RepID=UPI0023D9B8FB|nr:BF3164 family lipoprotein [Paraflavitalea sp. CAU 1676]MDF2191474.1 BF3164 family lipoprotein [Paraflavitalea sp. CAU 1676]